MKLGVYVGSFNPVHKGHIKIVNYLLDNYLDKVIIMPTGAYWDKDDLIDIEDRINMIKFYENERIIIENEKNDLPYTYLVMEFLKEKYENNELYLIIGADNIVNFDKWKKYNKLLKDNLIIINRDGIDIKYYLDKLNKNNNFIITDKLEDIDISSTQIRKFIKEKKFDELLNLIDKQVFYYIVDNKLYV